MLASRYLRSRRDFLSLVKSVAVASLVLSISILLASQAVIAGFDRELRERILGIVPHVSLYSRDGAFSPYEALQIANTAKGVNGAAAAVDLRVLGVTSTSSTSGSGGTRVRGLWILGVDPKSYGRASRLLEHIDSADLAELSGSSFGILMADSLATALGVQKGQYVTLVLSQLNVTIFGPVPRQKRVRVLGTFDTGTFLDMTLAVMTSTDAQRLAGHPGLSNVVNVKLDNPFAADMHAFLLERQLADVQYFTTRWTGWLEGLYVAIGSSKRLFLLLLSVLVAVAAFNLLSSVALLVNERASDIAILRSMGAGSGTVLGGMLVVGMTVTVVGVCLGVLGGWLLGMGLKAGFPLLEKMFDMELMSEYAVTTLPVAFQAVDFLVVAAIGIAMGSLSSLYAAWRASVSNPADVLRHD